LAHHLVKPPAPKGTSKLRKYRIFFSPAEGEMPQAEGLEAGRSPKCMHMPTSALPPPAPPSKGGGPERSQRRARGGPEEGQRRARAIPPAITFAGRLKRVCSGQRESARRAGRWRPLGIHRGPNVSQPYPTAQTQSCSGLQAAEGHTSQPDRGSAQNLTQLGARAYSTAPGEIPHSF
jgi:hypothetical protein